MAEGERMVGVWEGGEYRKSQRDSLCTAVILCLGGNEGGMLPGDGRWPNHIGVTQKVGLQALGFAQSAPHFLLFSGKV